MSLGPRICQIINDHNSTVAELAREIKTARRSVHRWINGTHEPLPKYLHRIHAMWPDVDLHWLLTGEQFEGRK